MYKTPDKSQPSLLDFDQPLGLRMNPDNRWVQLADRVPWGIFEEKYAALFPSGTGNVAKPLRLALGSLIIQNRFQYSDRELVEQLSENPYLQYFIGPNSTGALAFPLTMGRIHGWRMLTTRSVTEWTWFLYMYSCCWHRRKIVTSNGMSFLSGAYPRLKKPSRYLMSLRA